MTEVSARPADATNPDISRSPAVIEMVGVVGLALATLWAGRLLSRWGEWERGVLGGWWSIQLVVFAVVPLVVVTALGMRPGRLGVTFGDIRRPLQAGLTALAVVGPVSGVGVPAARVSAVVARELARWIGAAHRLRVGPAAHRPDHPQGQTDQGRVTHARGPVGSGRSAGRRRRSLSPDPGIGPRRGQGPAGAPGGRAGKRAAVPGVWCKRAWTRHSVVPYHLFGADLGWGVVLVAVLLRLSHLLSPSGPGNGGWALWTTVAGLLFGYIRAKGGSFVASAVVHGVLAVKALFSPAGA